MKSDNGQDNGQKEYFISPSRGKRDFLDVIEGVVEFINEDVASKYAVVVGTDSDETVVPNGHAGLANFVSVVTVHRVGKHGRYFWKRIPGIKTFDRHDRMLKEATFSLELARRVVTHLRERLINRPYDFEIHLDIGQNGPTKSMIQEVVGMIRAYNFEAKTKPESYAASAVADRHV